MATAQPNESDSPAQTGRHTNPFQIGPFRALLVVRLFTIVAMTGMSMIVAWQAYNIARQTMAAPAAAAQLGLIGLIQFSVLFVLTPFAGLAADRFQRTRIAMVTLAVLCCSASVLALASYEGWISLPLIFANAAVLGSCRAFQGPALGSLTPNIVPKDLLPRAIAISSMFWQMGGIVGPAIAGYAYAVKPQYAYGFSAILIFASIVAMIFVGRVPQAPPDRDRHPIRQVIDGIAYVRTNKIVFGAITLDLFAVLLAGTAALLPVYARDILHVGSRGLGHLAAAPGIGAGLTALWFSFRPLRHNVGPKMMAAVAIFGLATMVFGATAFLPQQTAIVVALVAMATWGSADMFSVFVRQSLIQLHTPDAMRGRVSSASMMTISASNELGEAESGFLAALIGPVAAVILGGAGAIVVTFAWLRLFPELRLARTFDPPDHLEVQAPAKNG